MIIMIISFSFQDPFEVHDLIDEFDEDDGYDVGNVKFANSEELWSSLKIIILRWRIYQGFLNKYFVKVYYIYYIF